MSEINLLQNEGKSGGENTGLIARLVSRLLILLLVLALLGYAGLYVYNMMTTKKLATVKDSVKADQSEALSNKDRNELVTRQEQMLQLKTFVDNHLYWSYLLPELARVTLKSAKYTAIEAHSDGNLNLSVTLPSYQEIDKYLQIFDLPEYNQQFSNVRIVNLSNVQTKDSVETQVELQLTFNPSYIKGRLK